MNAELSDLRNFGTSESIQELANSNTIPVFVMACFGKGEATDNAKAFYEELTAGMDAKAGQAIWSGAKFGVFGLGKSTSYPENYQAVSKKMDAKMLEFGAERIGERGEGDDVGDALDDAFDDWSESFLDEAKSFLASLPKADSEPEKKVAMPTGEGKASSLGSHESSESSESSVEFGIDHTTSIPIVRWEQLCAKGAEKSAIHVVFDTSEAPEKSLYYESGDYLGLFARNRISVVNQCLTALGYSGKEEVKLPVAMQRVCERKSEKHAIDTVPLEIALYRFCDLSRPLKRVELREWCDHITDPLDLALIKTLERSQSSPSSSQALSGDLTTHNEWIEKHDGRLPCIRDLLPALSSLSFASPTEFVELCAPIAPRYYSIASSHILDPPNEIALCVRQVPGGLCSNWLSDHVQDEKHAFNQSRNVEVFVQSSDFRLPKDHAGIPLIFAACGTGIAPIRAFCRERAAAGVAENTYFYYGCDKESEDFLYHEEILASGVQVRPCFTKETDVRIQDLLRENAEETWDALKNKNAMVFVCGNPHLEAGVNDELVDIAMRKGGLGEKVATEYVAQLKADGRILLDIFE